MIQSIVTVSPQWLYAHLNRFDVVVIDCRFSLSDPHLGRQQYLAGHIPGAYYLDLNCDLSGPASLHGGRHPLPNAIDLAETLSSMGVTSETLVVAYDDSRFAFAARLWWLLHYLGHEQAVVLNGGFSAYQGAGYPVTTELPLVREGTFIPQPQLHRVVDIAVVKARKDCPGIVLIDAREAERYRGEREPIDPVAGHIPGAVNYPWQMFSDTQGCFQPCFEHQSPSGNSRQALNDLPMARLHPRDRLRQGAASPSHPVDDLSELKQAKEIFVYCGSGVTACVNLLALEALGIQTGKLYPGSWSDWCSYEELPIAQGEKQ